MAFTTPRTWTDGELVNAAIMNPHIRDNFRMTMHTLARKTADQTVNNSTTLVNVTDLGFSVDVNEVWLVQAWLMYESSTTADIKFGWTVPASASIRWGFLSGDPTTGNIPQWGWGPVTNIALATTGTLNNAGAGAGVVNGVSFTGIAAIAGTAGTMQLQGAQQNLHASDTKFLTNSALVGCRLA